MSVCGSQPARASNIFLGALKVGKDEFELVRLAVTRLHVAVVWLCDLLLAVFTFGVSADVAFLLYLVAVHTFFEFAADRLLFGPFCALKMV